MLAMATAATGMEMEGMGAAKTTAAVVATVGMMVEVVEETLEEEMVVAIFRRDGGADAAADDETKSRMKKGERDLWVSWIRRSMTVRLLGDDFGLGTNACKCFDEKGP